MPTKITTDVLESYLYCKTKAHLKLARQQEDKSEYENMLVEVRREVRLTAIDKMMAKHSEEHVSRNVPLNAVRLKQGPHIILDAQMKDDRFRLSLDGLKRTDGPSNLGDFHYAPILFHDGRKIGKEQRQLLAIYGLLLSKIQGMLPNYGAIWNDNGIDVKESRVRLTLDLRKTERILRDLKEEVRTKSTPGLILNQHCQICEYRRRCHDEAVQADNLSLLRGMGEKELKKWKRRGIFTLTQLSCTYRPRRKRQKLTNNHYPHQFSLKALAIRENRLFVNGPVDIPDSPVNIFLDLEGNLDGTRIYLIGALVIQDGSETRHSFWAESQADEERIIGQFLDLVRRLPEFRLFCYGAYELKFLRRIQSNPDEDPLVEKILASSCNVLSVIRSHVYFPTYSNSLKDIGRYLGCRWSGNVQSGLSSVVWRRTWERTLQMSYKKRLIQYNLEDCMALRVVTSCLSQLALPDSDSEERSPRSADVKVSRVEELEVVSNRRDWGVAKFSIPDLKFVNDRAYFDYQRDRVYLRTSKILKRVQKRKKKATARRLIKPTHKVDIVTEECPACHGRNLTRTADSRLSRLAYDLTFRSGVIRRKVIQHKTSWHYCGDCENRFLPPKYSRLAESFHGLNSWVVYQLVRHRVSYSGVAEMLDEFFGIPSNGPRVYEIKLLMSRHYQPTYDDLWSRLLAGPILHVDETEVKFRGGKKGYIWVFTNMEEVVFLFRESREGSFLKDLLCDFKGVLITDFYSAYDSLDCEQQKCLIHLIRDMNEDLRRSPWDEQFKSLISAFGRLIRTIVTTIDEYGLKHRHLNKHQADVDKFYRMLSQTEYDSELAEQYYQRLTRTREKLFTFLKHDGVPWNNNNAEHAVKQFASYRREANGCYTESGLADYLVLLSLRLTCNYKGVSFLSFLLSQQEDIDLFRHAPRKKPPVAGVQQIPEGVISCRRDRIVKGVTHRTN